VLNPKLNALRQLNPSSFSSPAHRLSCRPLQNQVPFFTLPAKAADILDFWLILAEPKTHQKTRVFKT
jgi:hypothetical protein